MTVFLTNGTRLEGKILAFDPQTILVDSGEQSLVYKTMILTISPPRKGMRPRRGPGGRPPGRFEGQPREGRPPMRDRGDGPPREPRVPVVRYKRRLPDR